MEDWLVVEIKIRGEGMAGIADRAVGQHLEWEDSEGGGR